MNYLITGGCGFIGSHFVMQQIEKGHNVVNLDKLTYAAQPTNLSSIEDSPNYHFVKGDIGDYERVLSLLQEHSIDRVVNFAAESHVDNSIDNPGVFIETNISGTYNLLRACLDYWTESGQPEGFRMLHVSTDEVYGDLPLEGDEKFTENTSYKPSSPYSASKAASDHLVHAWNRTFGLPAIITNCSNNYGPHQHPEKLIPKMILNGLKGEALPVYGQGLNVRDWIYVEDHCAGIDLALEKGVIGETYCFGGNCEKRNIDIVHAICDALDDLAPKAKGSYRDQITFVEDRKGHDLRYAIDDSKAVEQLGYKRPKPFEKRFLETIKWYMEYHKNHAQKAA